MAAAALHTGHGPGPVAAARGYLHFVQDNALLLFTGFLLSLTSSYGQTHFISAFAGEITQTFRLSQGQWGVLYAVSTLASAFVMVWAGILTDRFRVRRLGVAVMVVLAAACLSMAVIQSALLLVLVIFALRLAGQGMMGHIAGVAMARWFVATRGKALAISSLGFACGQAVMPLVVAALLPVMQWRTIWLGASGVILLTIPLTLCLLRHERVPQAMADTSEAAGMEGRHWTRAEALRHPVFWLMLPALLGPPTWGTALFFHQVNFAEAKGWDLLTFVGMFPIMTLTAVAVTFFNGWLIDRIGAARIMRIAMLPFVLAFATLWHAQSVGMVTLGMFLFGVSLGLVGTLVAAFWAEVYGTRHIGSIKAVSSAVMVLGSALGPGITGVGIDLGYSFPDQMIGISGYFGFASATTFFAIRLILPHLPTSRSMSGCTGAST